MQQYPYISVVGSLMYLAVTTRPDITYAARMLARFNSNPGPAHWQAAKHVLRYLKGTTHHKLVYHPSTSPEPFITYSDADHGGNPDNGKSTGGYVVKIGSGVVSWSSKLQPFLSTMKQSTSLLLRQARRSSGCVSSWGSLAMTSLAPHCSGWTISLPLQ